jgi:hypothetical protein
LIRFYNIHSPGPSHRDPLWYDGGYTSDAEVVTEHNTENGAHGDNSSVALGYYPVYHHVNTIETTVRLVNHCHGGPVAGGPGRTHFEVGLDTENLTRLVGRTTGQPLRVRTTLADGSQRVYFRSHSSGERVQ